MDDADIPDVHIDPLNGLRMQGAFPAMWTVGMQHEADMSTMEARRSAQNKAGRAWGGDRHRGRLKVPEHAHPMVRLLFVEMNRQMTTIREVAERSGVHEDAISGWRYRFMPTLANLDAAFNALGLKLTVREIDPQ